MRPRGGFGPFAAAALTPREAILDARRRARRVEVAHELSDRHPRQRRLRRFRETVEKLTDRGALTILGSDVGQRALRSLQMLYAFLDRDPIRIAAGHVARPIAADLLD